MILVEFGSNIELAKDFANYFSKLLITIEDMEVQCCTSEPTEDKNGYYWVRLWVLIQASEKDKNQVSDKCCISIIYDILQNSTGFRFIVKEGKGKLLLYTDLISQQNFTASEYEGLIISQEIQNKLRQHFLFKEFSQSYYWIPLNEFELIRYECVINDEDFHKPIPIAQIAKRLANLLVKEIWLYNKDKLVNDNLYSLLKDRISSAQQHYKERIGGLVYLLPDYFYQELVDQLYNGDSSKLGDYKFIP